MSNLSRDSMNDKKNRQHWIWPLTALIVGLTVGFALPKVRSYFTSSKLDKTLELRISVLSPERRWVGGADLSINGKFIGRTDSYGVWQGWYTLSDGKDMVIEAKKDQLQTSRTFNQDQLEDVTATQMRIPLQFQIKRKIPVASARVNAGVDLQSSDLPEDNVPKLPLNADMLSSVEVFFSQKFNDPALRVWATRLRRELTERLVANGVKISNTAPHRLQIKPLSRSRNLVDAPPMIIIEGIHRGSGETLYSFLELQEADQRRLAQQILADVDRLLVKPGFAFKDEDSKTQAWALSQPLYWPKLWTVPGFAFVRAQDRHEYQIVRQAGQFSIQGDLTASCQAHAKSGLCPVQIVAGPSIPFIAGQKKQWLRYTSMARNDKVYVSGEAAIRGENGLWTFVSADDSLVNVTIVRDGASIVHRAKIKPMSGRIAVLDASPRPSANRQRL